MNKKPIYSFSFATIKCIRKVIFHCRALSLHVKKQTKENVLFLLNQISNLHMYMFEYVGIS